MTKKQMNYSYMYKGQKTDTMKTGYEKYTPGTLGKIAMGITIPSALIAFISVIVAAFGMIQVLMVTLVTFIISFIGSIVIAADIVVFNRRQRKQTEKSTEPKQLDIMRIVHLFIGVVVGIVIGYLIWGAKYLRIQ